MPAENLSIRFYLNENKNKAGKHPVYVRIIVNRKKVEFATDNYLIPSEWNAEKQRAKKNVQMNDKLNDIESEINEIRYNLAKEGKEYTRYLNDFRNAR